MIVGYYKGARLLHRTCITRPGKIPGMSRKFPMHFCEVDASDAFLVPHTQRTFEIPSPRSAGKGFPGQSNIWYPKVDEYVSVAHFARKLRAYLRSLSSSVGDMAAKGRGSAIVPPRGSDYALNAEVEKRATSTVQGYFQRLGYCVKTVERDDVGWDFEARKGAEMLRLEVKGRSASDLRFELTPNEYKKLQEHWEDYRLCVVCDALESPEIYVLRPRQNGSVWNVELENGEIAARLEPELPRSEFRVRAGTKSCPRSTRSLNQSLPPHMRNHAATGV